MYMRSYTYNLITGFLLVLLLTNCNNNKSAEESIGSKR